MIIIQEQDPIVMTSIERERLLAEYRQAMTYYAGPPISFENWIRERNQPQRKFLLQE